MSASERLLLAMAQLRRLMEEALPYPFGFDGAQDRGLDLRRALLAARVGGTQHDIG